MRQRKLKPAIPAKRQGYWYLERRVPARFRMRDPRKTVKLSTRIRITDDPCGIAARRAVAELDAELLRFWEGARAVSLGTRHLRFSLTLFSFTTAAWIFSNSATI